MEDVDVYFPATPQAWDDLTITHTGISVIQSTDYYPDACLPKLQRRQGLVMREEKNEPYRFGYQGQFAEMDKETGWNHFEAREYDPIVGRWISGDPARQFWAPYNGMGNNPINGVDPDGRFKTRFGAFLYKIFNGGGSIEFAQDRGEYFVGNQVPYDGPGAGVAFQRSFEWDDGSKSFGEYVWNTPVARAVVPDFVNVGAGFNGIAGVGGYTNVDIQWVTRGPEASLYPAITITQAVGVGFSVDATINVGGTNYLGSVRDIRVGMLQTSLADGNATIWISAGISPGGKIGIEGSYTPTNKGYGLIGRQLIIGGALPLGPLPVNAAGGVSNTFIIHDFYHGR